MGTEEVKKQEGQEGEVLVLTPEEIEVITEKGINNIVDWLSEEKGIKGFMTDEMNIRNWYLNKLPPLRAKEILKQIEKMTEPMREKTHQPSYKTVMAHELLTGEKYPKKTAEEQAKIDEEVVKLKLEVKNKLLSR